MSYVADASIESKVKSIQNWINSIGFDAWKARRYRSIELLGGSSREAFKPDQYRPELIRRLMAIVSKNRELVVVDAVASLASGLRAGRLLAHRFGETTCTAESQAITDGFFDEYDVPSWDTWVDFVENDAISQSGGAYLLSWVPPELVPMVEQAIHASFEENIFWVE